VSRLFTRVFLVILVLVIGNSVAFYALSIPPIRRITYQQEEAAARRALESVYDLVEAEHENIQAYKKSALEAYQRELRDVVALQEAFIRTKYDDFKRGRVSEAEAQRSALEQLRTFRYGKNDYLWVANYESFVISHPDSKLHGADYSQVRDIHGRLIVPPTVALARREGEGFYSYYWRRLDEEDPVEKLTFARHFPAWRWVIATGVYVDDVEKVVQKRQRAVVEKLRQMLKGIKLAKTGYMFVFDARQNMIIHPQLEGKDLSALLDPVTRRPIVRELMEAARSPSGTLRYRWDRPDDPGNYDFEKISWVRYFAGFDWYLASSVYTDELKVGARMLRNRILAITLVLLACSLVLSYLFISRLLGPIGALSALASRVRDGDLSATFATRRRDEIGVLATGFNEMVDRLRRNIEALDQTVAQRTSELEDKNLELQVSLAELGKTEQELKESEQRAVEASRAKSVFLATMSHEIRTPMNAVIGMTSLLLDTPLTAEQREFAETIRQSGDALLTLINDILDFSKIEAGRMDLEQQPFDVRECVDSAVDLLSGRAADKGVELTCAVDRDVPVAVVGDVTRLRQILANLIANAVKFTEQGQVVVSVGAGPLPDDARAIELRFAVRDTGIGIAPERMERLFHSFTQVDAATTRRYGGTGLGLAISRRLCELMGGRMWAESAAGQGATFHFTVRAVEAPAAAPAYLGTQVPELRGKRALIVGDGPTGRHLVATQLEAWGMVPCETAPAEALAGLRADPPFDLVLLDLPLQGADGVSLARQIRRQAGAGPLRLVLLTPLGQRRTGAEEPRLVDGWVSKPVRASALYDVVVRLIVARGERPPTGTTPPAPRFDGELGRTHPLAILIAEDNATNQRLALRLLERLGYRADVAANGLEAVAAVRRQPYDLVLMDVQMPEMDGLEATRVICRELGAGRRPRIVAMTANAFKEDRESCLAAGMDDYLGKPIRVPELIDALRQCRPRAAAGGESAGETGGESAGGTGGERPDR
jgi:signal transduction histidine kinase/DNA-binding response OmpR family regulator